eukprot:867513-Pyramimonas_sp.AAC.1
MRAQGGPREAPKRPPKRPPDCLRKAPGRPPTRSQRTSCRLHTHNPGTVAGWAEVQALSVATTR